MRISLRSVLVSAGLVATAGLAAGSAFAGGPTVTVLLLREHGVGSSNQVDPYLKKLIGIAAQQNGWDAASADKAKYVTTRADASAFIASDKPHFGIFSLAAFLALRSQYGLDPVGQAMLSIKNGEQYFIVSSSLGSLAECKGKQLASDHFDDQRFVEKVVAQGAFTKGDFTIVETKRFGQAGAKAANNEVECALINDAQLEDLQKSSPAIKIAWSSPRLPRMVVAAFNTAPAAEKAAFKDSLPKICPADATVCANIGLQSLAQASASDYAGVVALY